MLKRPSARSMWAILFAKTRLTSVRRDRGICRFCKAAMATPHRRLWDCVRWTQVRVKAVMGLGIEVTELRDDLPMLTKVTGIMLKDPELVGAKQLAERAPEWTDRR
eukprot:12988160-Heterocapsa_arctica.AAC.1